MYLRVFDFTVLQAFDWSSEKIGDLYGIFRRIPLSENEHGHWPFPFVLVASLHVRVHILA